VEVIRGHVVGFSSWVTCGCTHDTPTVWKLN
jgi:hypothetical protein